MLVSQSCWTLCDPTYCSPPGSSVHGTLQARILEWVVILFSRESSQHRDLTKVTHISGRFSNVWATREENRNKLHHKWNVLQSHQNHPPNPPQFVKILSSMKPVPVIKKLGMAALENSIPSWFRGFKVKQNNANFPLPQKTVIDTKIHPLPQRHSEIN